MKALLYKDFYLERQQLCRGIFMQVFVAVIGVIVFRGITVGNFGGAAMLLPLLLQAWPVCIGVGGIAVALSMANVMELDEKSEWNKLECALPISTFKIVVSKYLLVLIGHTCMWIVTWMSSYLCVWAAGNSFSSDDMKNCLTIWASGFVLILFVLPFDIILPAKSASMVRMGVSFGIVLILIALLAIGIEMDEIIRRLVKFSHWLYSYAPICIIVLTVISVGITMKLKQKRGYKI